MIGKQNLKLGHSSNVISIELPDPLAVYTERNSFLSRLRKKVGWRLPGPDLPLVKPSIDLQGPDHL